MLLSNFAYLLKFLSYKNFLVIICCLIYKLDEFNYTLIQLSMKILTEINEFGIINLIL